MKALLCLTFMQLQWNCAEEMRIRCHNQSFPLFLVLFFKGAPKGKMIFLKLLNYPITAPTASLDGAWQARTREITKDRWQHHLWVPTPTHCDVRS